MIRKPNAHATLIFSFPSAAVAGNNKGELEPAERAISQFEQRNNLGLNRDPKLVVFGARRLVTAERLKAITRARKNLSRIFIFHFDDLQVSSSGVRLRQSENRKNDLDTSSLESISKETGVRFTVFANYTSTPTCDLSSARLGGIYPVIQSPIDFIEKLESLLFLKPFFSVWDLTKFCAGVKTRYDPQQDAELFYSIVARRRLWDRDVEQFSSEHRGSREDGIDTLYQFLADVKFSDEAVAIANYFHAADPEASVRAAAGSLLSTIDETTTSAPRIVRRNYQSFDFMESLVKIPSGGFLMGSKPSQDADSLEEEQPLHEVHVDEFSISKLQIRVKDYIEYLRETAGDRGAVIQAEVRVPDAPITKISWYEAISFCRWATVRAREASLIDETMEVRLPTEAEWEKSAKGPASFIYPWGNKFDETACNYRLSEPNEVVPVGSFSPRGDSGYGISDMAGNAWDWTLSLWGKRFDRPDYRYPYDQNDGRESVVAGGEFRRIIRGGGYYYHSYCMRTSTRNAAFPVFNHSGGGFRIVVSPRLLIEKAYADVSG